MNHLEKIEALATQIMVEEFPDKIVYNNIDYHKRLQKWITVICDAESISEKEKTQCQIAGWLIYTGFKDFEEFGKLEKAPYLYEKCIPFSIAKANEIMKAVGIEEVDQKSIIDLIKTSSFQITEEQLTPIQRIFKDALRAELSAKHGFGHIKTLYQQFLLTDAVDVGKSGWYEMALEFLFKYKYLSEYGKSTLQPNLENVIAKIEKASKKLQKQRDIALKRELSVSDSELKQLKKNLGNAKGRDDRGIQTMFRSTSKNHYTLNRMVDGKASIMISVNAIILSLIIGGAFQNPGMDTEFSLDLLPNIAMLITAIFSIIFAVISILPDNTHGKFTKEEIMDKRGNLLFFGNFHNMKFPDYEWGILEMLSDQEYLYSTMIRDIYYLGKTLQKKYWAIRISLYVFIIGLVISSLLFLMAILF